MKLTPLNIVSAICLVAGAMILTKPAAANPVQVNMNGLWAGLCMLTAIIAFISDLIFRKFIPLLRKLWVVEGMLILMTVVLMLILKSTLA